MKSDNQVLKTIFWKIKYLK